METDIFRSFLLSNGQLSENQCGMETLERDLLFLCGRLSENQCGMETGSWRRLQNLATGLSENQCGMETTVRSD